MWIGGASAAGGNEYGSKKTMEGKLKKIATISWILFVIVILIYPFVK